MDKIGRTVIVAGGGYSGVLAANRLRGRLPSKDRVVLATNRKALLNRVRLHERAVHGTEVSISYGRLLARGVEHMSCRVTGLNTQQNTLNVELGVETQQLRYDALVLALGSELRSNTPSVSPLAHALRDEQHAMRLAAALPDLPDGAQVVVVGGGLTAIELAAEIAEHYPRLRVEMITQRFAEGLAQDATAAREALLEGLRQLGVQIREGVRVRELEAHAAVLEDGTRLECGAAILASGFSATPLKESFALPLSPDGRVQVDADLRVAGVPNVFVVGDLAAPPAANIGRGLATTRMSCASAMPMGAHAADQVARLLRGAALQGYSFRYSIQCVSLGRRQAVVLFVDADDVPTGRIVSGRRAALIKEGVCRMVIGALRLERWLPGVYTWPRAPKSTRSASPGAEQRGY